MQKLALIVRNAKTVPNLKLTEKNSKKKKGFWTFNKNVRYWNAYNPDWSYRNDFFFIKTLKKVYLEISIVKLSFNLKIM